MVTFIGRKREEQIRNRILTALGVVALVSVAWFDVMFGVPDSQSGRPTGMSDSDYNYVNGRFREEGLSAKDADVATRAVNNAYQHSNK